MRVVLVGVAVADRHGVTLSNGVVLVTVVFRRRLLTVGVVALAMCCSLKVTEWLCYSSGRVVSLSWLLWRVAWWVRCGGWRVLLAVSDAYCVIVFTGGVLPTVAGHCR